jgi:hypothetical protein
MKKLIIVLLALVLPGGLIGAFLYLNHKKKEVEKEEVTQEENEADE